MPPRRGLVLWLDTVRQDARYGLRGLRRTPFASAVMIASIALGIGAATAVFTLTDVMLLRPLPYPDADRLVVPYETVTVLSRASTDTVSWTYASYDALRRTVRSIEDAGFAAWVDATVRVSETDVPVRVEAITRSLLTTFSIQPQLGRLFGGDEDDASAPATVALISDRLWHTTYGSRSDILGQAILVNGVPVTVVGVMPRRFTGFTVAGDLWLPVRMTARIDPSPRWTERFESLRGTVIGRMAAGTGLPALRRQLAIAMPLISEAAPDQSLGSRGVRGAGVMRLQEARRHPLVTPILTLMGVGVVSLLLIVCANIASILLARGHARRGELGVRIALGASQRRVGRQVLTESAILGVLGLPAGVLLGVTAAEMIAELRPMLPQNWTLLRGTDLLAGASLSPDGRVLAFAALVAGLATLIFGIGPALVASRINAARLLTSATDSHATLPTRSRQFLVAGQIALATVLLVIAGLMTRSLRELLHTDLGFRAEDVVAFHLTSMDTTAAARIRRQELVARLEATPGIDGVAMTGCKPFDVACMFSLGVRSVDETDASARPVEVEYHAVSASYFQVLRVPVVAGRGFVAADTAAETGRVVLSASAARRLFGSRPALGRRVVLDVRVPRPMEVVGVVGDVRFKAVEAGAAPAIYLLAGEDATAPRFNSMMYVRAAMPPSAAASVLGRVIRETSAPVSATTAGTLTDFVRGATSSTRFVALLLLGFAASAALLAGLGIYGVVSYIVSQRLREFGVRLVLGANGHDLLLATVRRSVWVVGGGVSIGLLGAGLGAQLLRAFLYGVGTFDVATYLAVTSLVVVLALVATLIPARRITHIDPATILRT